jgi:hypothetical protein
MSEGTVGCRSGSTTRAGAVLTRRSSRLKTRMGKRSLSVGESASHVGVRVARAVAGGCNSARVTSRRCLCAGPAAAALRGSSSVHGSRLRSSLESGGGTRRCGISRFAGGSGEIRSASYGAGVRVKVREAIKRINAPHGRSPAGAAAIATTGSRVAGSSPAVGLALCR